MLKDGHSQVHTNMSLAFAGISFMTFFQFFNSYSFDSNIVSATRPAVIKKFGEDRQDLYTFQAFRHLITLIVWIFKVYIKVLHRLMCNIDIIILIHR